MSVGIRVEHRTSRSEKTKDRWYKPLAKYLLNSIDTSAVKDINDKKDVLQGIISDTYYKKVLNPFNATDKKFTRWRAEMRNFDIMKDVIRRYMGEFSKQPFDFQVKVNDPDVITRFNDAFAIKISELAVQLYVNTLNEQGANTGQQTKEVPDFQQFFEEFRANYVDDVAIQGQNLLEAIIDWTDSKLKYYTAFYNYIVLGQTYTYRDVRNDFIHKEVIDPTEYFPINNGEAFIEDHNEGVRYFTLTLPKILSNFGDIIDEKTYGRIETWFKNYSDSAGSVYVPLTYFKSMLDEKAYTTFLTDSAGVRLTETTYRLTNNANQIDCYHFVFTTQVKVWNVAYIDLVTGTTVEDIVESDTLDKTKYPTLISYNAEWLNEFWEFYQFGSEYEDIFTIPRPIAFQRRDGNNKQKVKSPYNGICEVIPNTGFTFSIPDAVLPFQIARNIFAFYRERIIAKNKDKIMIVPKSLMGDKDHAENSIYRLEANSIFEFDDSEDDSGQKSQHIRILDASLSQFIAHITDLMDRMKEEAWETVDMNQQRYGDINTSAGKATTEEAIIRSSMGSVILFTMFERFLEREYTADLEYSKRAYFNGKQGTYTDGNGETKFLDLDIDKHLLANYGLHVVSSVTENERRKELKEIAFASSQNGGVSLAYKTVLSRNTAAIKKALQDFEKAEREYQRSIANEREQIMLQVEQTKAQDAQAERDKDIEIARMKESGDMQRAIMEAQVKILDIESRISTAPIGTDTTDLISSLDSQKLELERLKAANDMQKHSDTMNLKRDEMKSKERIAKTNKNRYDTKK